MKTTKTALALTLAAALLGGCHRTDQEADPTRHAAPAEQPAATSPVPAEAGTAKPFDPSSVPMSTAALGEFPYFSLPDGYEANTEKKLDFERFPFWTGDRFEWVEGPMWEGYVMARNGKQYSQVEMTRNLESVIASAGGVKVFEGIVPRAAVEGLGEDITVNHVVGVCGIGDDPSTTYLLRRADRNIWVSFNSHSARGCLAVAETKPFVATAALLPAAELKERIDSAGKVALQVNFATDSARILPDSQPQIAQVVQLLEDDPTLRLAINGHTDNSGDAAHNRQLSEGRAKAVVDAITAQGIDASRLTAQGFGDTRPVADNGTEEGKAKNRRVELVKG